MLTSIKRVAAIAAAALAVGGVGLGVAGTAHAATTTTHETTSFTYASGSATLTVPSSNVVPGNGTAVSFDLQAALNHGQTAAAQAIQLNSVIAGIEAAPFNVPAVDIVNAPTGPVTLNPAGDTTLNLFVVDSHSHSFEVSGVKGGVAITVPPISPPTGTGKVTWDKLTFVPDARPYVYDGHIDALAGTRATVGWSDSVHGWPVRSDGRKCVVVQEYGPGFTDALGGAHTGYTCDTTGYLTGMQIGHGYSLFVWPAAAGDSYAGSHAVVPGSVNAHIYLVATAA